MSMTDEHELLVWKLQGKKDMLGNLVVRRKIILRENILKIYREGVDWIQLAKDSVLWPAFVNTAMSSVVPQKAAIFLTAWVINFS
jgi:hypothetical protein